tara:strand:- start:506 stop:655 length:150 start_codon:yes stop_codon:yes gene_type:complete
MKVFVVIEEFYGTVTDVNAYKNEPKNFKAMEEGEEEGRRCYVLEIKEQD